MLSSVEQRKYFIIPPKSKNEPVQRIKYEHIPFSTKLRTWRITLGMRKSFWAQRHDFFWRRLDEWLIKYFYILLFYRVAITDVNSLVAQNIVVFMIIEL